MKLKDRVCVIVGAGQTPGETIGNGRATAITFAREGASLLLVDHIEERVAETQAMIAEEGFDASVLVADVTEEAGCKSISDRANRQFGRIDVLHYNVGKSQGDGEVTELALANWSDIVTLNLTGYYLTCKHALPSMRERQSGVIVGISSMAAHGGHMNMTYGVTKTAMNSLTKSMAIHNARWGIRVNAIMPGPHGHPHGHRTPRQRAKPPSRRNPRRTRQPSPPPPPTRHRLGRSQRGSIPRLRRRQLHHRHLPAGGRRPFGTRVSRLGAAARSEGLGGEGILPLARAGRRVPRTTKAARTASVWPDAPIGAWKGKMPSQKSTGAIGLPSGVVFPAPSPLHFRRS